MIDVQLNPFGRSLMGMMLGVMKMQAMIQAKNVAELTKQVDNIQGLKRNIDLWNDISMNTTTRILDHRFNAPTYKKSATKFDRNLDYLTKQQSLRSRAKFNSAVSQYNQRLSETKVKTSFKLINVNQVL